MEATDPLIQLLEECREGGQPAFTLVYSSGELDVTPRRDASADPVTVTRDAVGYTVTHGAMSSEWTAPELAVAAIHFILGTAHLVRA